MYVTTNRVLKQGYFLDKIICDDKTVKARWVGPQ